MPGTAARRGIWALGIVLVASLLLVAALPFFASTQIVRDRIAQQIGTWSGYRVQLGDAPELLVWPTFRARLANVTFTEWGNRAGAPVIEAEEIEIDLSALAALRGEVVFTRLKLVRPVVRVAETGGPFPLPASPGGGKIAQSIGIARAVLAADPAEPKTAALPDDPFGTVELQDGRIMAAGVHAEEALVSGLNGTLTWPALNRAASFAGSGIWHGEAVTIEASAAEPLLLFAGGNAPVTLSLEAAPVSADFNGIANISDDAFLDGALAMASPSLRRLLEWTRSDISPGSAIGAVEMRSKVVGGARRLKFENAEIALDGNPGSGVLDVTLGAPMPAISGTLAFQSLDLRSLLSTFTPLPEAGSRDALAFEAPEPRQFDIDLRLSAARAGVGSANLTDVAATAQVRGGLATFDISDATAFGGTVQFGIRVDHAGRDSKVELRLVATDIEGGQLARQLGVTRVVPRARSTVSLILKGSGTSWETIMRNADGSVSASLGAGEIAGLDLAAFLARSGRAGFFALSEIAEGALPIETAQIKASLSNGIARIDRAEARSGGRMIALSGLIPFAGRGIALSGTVGPVTAEGDGAAPPPEPEAAFFVGGSWSEPFISPVPPLGPPD